MTAEVEYELEERAAIRQFEGGQDRPAAERLAGVDVAGRVEEAAKLQTLRAGIVIEALEKERDSVRRAWMIADNPEDNLRLKERWQEVCMQIVYAKEKEGLI